MPNNYFNDNTNVVRLNIHSDDKKVYEKVRFDQGKQEFKQIYKTYTRKQG